MFSLSPQQLSGEFNTLIDEENMPLIVVDVDTCIKYKSKPSPKVAYMGSVEGFN